MKIEFHTEDPEVYRLYPPRPISEDYPKWLNDTNPDQNEFSVNHCTPVMDYINSGYIIYNTYEYILKEKIQNFQKGTELETVNPRPKLRAINPAVMGGSCLPQKDIKSYFKIETDFKVITPPGYSCLVMQPFYDFNKDYQLLPGIIDTDKYDWTISTMGYTKNPDIRLMAGDRLLQIIPFKRENWKMELHNNTFPTLLMHYIKGVYKTFFHSKKSYK